VWWLGLIGTHIRIFTFMCAAHTHDADDDDDDDDENYWLELGKGTTGSRQWKIG
jgi:hypothetical protein